MKTSQTAPLPARYASVRAYGQSRHLGKTKTFELIGEGKFPSIKVGRKRLIDVDGADAYLASLAQHAA